MALPNGIQSTHELLDAHAHIWNHIFNFINSMSLKCAIQLRIPDIIHKHQKPITLSELIDALPNINKSKSYCLERLMRILIHSKFFTKVEISEDRQGYWLTPSSILLIKDEPMNMTSCVLTALDPILTDPYHHISEWFKNDDPTPFVTIHGRAFWEQLEQDLRLNQLFNESMAGDSWLTASVILKDCRQVFEGLKSMVDVAGGTGTMARAIVDAFPGLNCSVLELPHVVVGLEGTQNLTFVAGDMFDSIPQADAIFMKWILHNWPDEECVKILKNCKEAIPCKDKGGKVIIVDIVLNNQRDHEKKHDAIMETQLFYDMLMMVLNSGRERTEEDWAKIFNDAGFTSYKITNVLGFRSLIEVFP
ncbi:hypothetical protein DH2020_031507 [Rehmannia glutinosa]|uniref:Uncharacterized protein n=1 Tax=Rehmannia glutinosa TaxID=99300 RepID=A0ABR0VJG4_REHGL